MAATYDIVSQSPRVRSEVGGQFSNVIQVTFRTKPSNQPGMVDIPETMFTPDEVDRVVGLAAANIEAVQAL